MSLGKAMVSSTPCEALASMMAARREHMGVWPERPVSQTPSIKSLSGQSPEVLTTYIAASDTQ